MWLICAFGSAFFAGITAILSKIGVEDVNSNIATAIRTAVVFVVSWLLVLALGVQAQIPQIGVKTMVFLILSGLATGASWLCYFRALARGDVNKIAPIDKSSTILTMIAAFIFLGEPISPLKLVCIVLIAAGTYLMIEKKAAADTAEERGWLIWAVLSAVFAAMTSIFAKIGISDIDSNLGTAIRTGVVLIMAWGIVFAEGRQKEIRKISRKSLFFLVISALATGASWLCYFRALKDGAASIVVPIDKLSILVTILFSCIILREKLTAHAAAGLLLLVGGTLLLLYPDC